MIVPWINMKSVRAHSAIQSGADHVSVGSPETRVVSVGITLEDRNAAFITAHDRPRVAAANEKRF